MRLEKTLLILSIIGILILTLLTQTTSPTYTGQIKSIHYSNSKTTIEIENIPIELILFETNFVGLKKGDIIEFQGREDTYKNKKQIIIDKIILSQNPDKH